MRFPIVRTILLMVFVLFFASVSYANPSFTNGKIAFTSDRKGNYDIFIMDEDGKNIENITQDFAAETDPSWSPDGSMIVFSHWWGFIYAVNIDKQDSKPVALDGVSFFPLLSPDGGKIAFIEKPKRLVLWLSVMNIDGRNRRRLKQIHDLNDEPHTWSPDGRQIAFCEKGIVYVIDINTGKWEQIRCKTPNGMEIRAIDVDWSPVGNEFAIASYGNTRGIWIVNRDGSNARRVTKSNDRSPDGSQIAFQSLRDGDWDIYVIEANGQHIRRLTDNTASDMQPTWFRPVRKSVSPRSKLITTWGKLKEFWEMGVNNL